MNIMRFVLSIMFLLVCIVIISWDIYVIYYGDAQDTVSATLREWGARYPILPFVIGLLIGHIFWPIAPAAIPIPPGG